MTDPHLGLVIGERFRVNSRVGEGGMGVVYVADDLAAGGKAAVKFLHRQFLDNPDFVARFRQEAKSAGRFRHENAVRILDSGDDEDGVPYIAMEYCAGRSLKALLRDEGPFSVARACSIAAQTLGALDEAHKNGIIHRDLKPENIKVEVTADGQEIVKVLDFGVAKFVGTEDVQEMTGAVKTRTGVVFGTPKYMAPEQILGETVDSRSDIYAVGAILYEMLTGTAPFSSEDIMGFVTKHLKEPVEPLATRSPDLVFPPGLEKVVLETLEKNRVARPARAGDVAEALEKFAERKRSAASDAGPAKRGRAWGHLLFVLAGVLGAAAAWLLAKEDGIPAAVVSVSMGLGVAIAFLVFPTVGERSFWIRSGIVLAGMAVGVAVGAAVGPEVPASIALGGFLVYVLVSLAWGVGSRWLGLVLGGIAAPAVAILLLPHPAKTGKAWVWATEDHSVALMMLCIGLAFGVVALVAPVARGGRAR